MNTIKIIIARIYIIEGSHLLNKIVTYLQKEAKVRGVTVFRGISGFGESGSHTSSLVDLSLNLPLTIEFFDSEEKMNSALEYLASFIKSEHLIYWTAQANVN